MDHDIGSTGVLQEKIHKARRLLEPSLNGNSWNEEARHKAADALSRLFRTTDMVAISTLTEGRYVYVNDPFLRITGFSRDEVIGRTSVELGLWIDPDQRGEIVRTLQERGSIEHCEVQVRIRSGDILTASTYIERFEHAGEKYIITITHDITDIEKTVNTLQRERSKLKSILEAMEDGVCIINQQYTIEYANPPLVRDFGPAKGQRCFAYFHDRQTVCPACKSKEAIEGRSMRWEWHSSKAGKMYDLLDIPVQDALGRVSDLRIFHDITDRKQAQLSLQESEKRYRTLVETMSDGLVQGENGVINYVNERLSEMLGYAREEMIGRDLVGFLDRESRDVFPAQADRIRRGELGSFEMRWIRKDGGKISTISSPKLVLDGDGRIKGCFAVVHDITERKLGEEALQRSYEQVRNLSAYLQSVREEERTSVARAIHDELGQALTALKMDISWTSGKLRRDQKVLLGKSQEMLRLVDKTIKTVKRISSELRPGVLDDLGLKAAIQWQAREFQRRTNVPCAVTFDPNTIALDRERSTVIFRVFQEALTNVARHAGATRVLARLEENNGDISLTVSDNGKGIIRKQLSSPQSFGIIGMRERVNYFGGALTITGNLGKGTALTVTIPLKKKEVVVSASSMGEA